MDFGAILGTRKDGKPTFSEPTEKGLGQGGLEVTWDRGDQEAR